MRRALAFARAFAERAKLSPVAVDRLAIVVEEWTANIVEHGASAPGARIVLRLERLGDDVRLTCTDAGIAFDPRQFAPTGPNPDRGGGAGLALITAWSRICSHDRRRGRNRLVLALPAEAT